MDPTNTENATRIGNLSLIRKIAAGGMAEVWEARKGGLEGFSKRLAVKVILPHLTSNDDFIKMFLDEGRLAARLDHPNVCQLIDLGEDNGTYYMSMEYIDGVVLSAVMKEAAKRGIFVPFEHCCQIVIGACAGLDYAHSVADHDGKPLNLVHRDISPQNIMLTFDGNIKVVDFGIAKAATQIHHTQVGVLKGKYAYMSPEQATGESLDRRSDVFALGVVLWELTTGHRLFRADNEIATLHKILGGDYDLPSEYRDGFPQELEMIIMKALSMDRNTRFQDCGELQLALEDFLLRHGMAAGSKRLAYYVRWLLSDEEMPDLSSQPLSAISVAFEQSDPAINTPSRSEALASIPNASQGRVGSAPTQQMDSFPAGTFGSPEEESQHRRKRSGGGIWSVLVLLVVLGGGGAAAFFLMRPSEPMAVLRPWVVNSTPRGAEVTLNGEKSGQTRATLFVNIGQNYALRIYKKGYLPFYKSFGKITIKDVAKPLEVDLKPEPKDIKYGSVTITAKPDDAVAMVNGQKLDGSKLSAGLSLFTGRFRANEPHTLLVKHPGYDDHTETFTLKPDVQKVFSVELKKKEVQRKHHRRRNRPRPRPVHRPRPRPRLVASHTGTSSVGSSVLVIHPAKLRVASVPPGAIVKVNGQIIGSTPMRGYFEVEQGKDLELRVEKEDHKTHVQMIRLHSNQKKSFHIQLKSSRAAAKPSFVSIGSSPASVVYVNKKRIGTTPIFHRMPSGSYTVEFRTVKFQASHRQVLTFEPGPQKFFHRFSSGHLQVLSRPIAKVYIGHDYLGQSMQAPWRVPVGSYTVRLAFPNGKNVEKIVTIKRHKRTRIKVIQR